jgi:hypothetical protein
MLIDFRYGNDARVNIWKFPFISKTARGRALHSSLIYLIIVLASLLGAMVAKSSGLLLRPRRHDPLAFNERASECECVCLCSEHKSRKIIHKILT